MPFEFIQLQIKDVLLIKPKIFKDNRGFFVENYKKTDFVNAGIKDTFIQINHSQSVKGVLRGLHYQLIPHSQAKLVKCIRGAIFDVAVDIRHGSETFGKWVSAILNEDNHEMLYIPCGFAHGFVTLSEKAEILYSCTSEYAPEYDRGIIWNDPSINILWPIDSPILSQKDLSLPSLSDAENNFTIEVS